MNRLGIYMSTDYTESQIVVERFVVIENDWIDLSAMSSPLASPVMVVFRMWTLTLVLPSWARSPGSRHV